MKKLIWLLAALLLAVPTFVQEAAAELSGSDTVSPTPTPTPVQTEIILPDFSFTWQTCKSLDEVGVPLDEIVAAFRARISPVYTDGVLTLPDVDYAAVVYKSGIDSAEYPLILSDGIWSGPVNETLGQYDLDLGTYYCYGENSDWRTGYKVVAGKYVLPALPAMHSVTAGCSS